ncbi:glycosyltransferase family 2 protein [Microbacterium rhizomatis]|uniref:4,4'-diaponeurosporenoate glycosyltransferase n=1 Tax=Microbacterium rhizomatis TaxID=1631477 RepID=A0A5J5IYC0_9MICO|nr:glycosyltransferase family 2 protein [Microbacterium rhizomatis]KAA9106491.1 glycosyltransferase family 2 protein [Microbacterium rhizomatis]
MNRAATAARDVHARPTFVIAAHNEERVIGACLEALLGQDVRAGDIIVVANGCSDRTADVASDYGVTVIDRVEPGKAGALNAGDAVAPSSTRIYLDADIVVPDGGVAALVRRLAVEPSVAAVVPARRLETAGRQWPVRAYFSINERLPAFRAGLFGRGLIVLSAEGRSRFGAFPAMVADDLFLDSQFDESEKAQVDDVTVVVEAPYTTRELLNRLVRVRRGNAQMRAAAAAGEIDLDVRPADRRAWLRVALPHPKLWAAAVAYATITLVASRRARRAGTGQAAWGRDESTRERAATVGRRSPA